MKEEYIKFIVLIIVLLTCTRSFAQQDTAKVIHFNGDWSVTNNGFSFVPTFNLGKPATILELNTGGDRFTFEPQFRFDLDGMRPWSIIGFWRYKLINSDKMMLRVGTQFPAIAFSYEKDTVNSVAYRKILAQRFLPFDLTAHFKLSDKVSIGSFLLYAYGLEKAEQLNHSAFLSVYGVVKVPLVRSLSLDWNPQCYFLTIDGVNGLYTAHSLSLRHSQLPVSLQAMCNLELESDIDTDQFTWNLSIVYSFKNTFVRK